MKVLSIENLSSFAQDGNILAIIKLSNKISQNLTEKNNMIFSHC